MPISYQPEGVNLSYFKPILFDLIEFIVINIKGPRHQVANKDFVAKTQLLYDLKFNLKLRLHSTVPLSHVYTLQFL